MLHEAQIALWRSIEDVADEEAALRVPVWQQREIRGLVASCLRHFTHTKEKKHFTHTQNDISHSSTKTSSTTKCEMPALGVHSWAFRVLIR
ncbi:hypothetical protein [Antarctobacter heliothermus]|uniref:hypothetical protein n=1 Tax=Antarctobacter heliothermus TaxID=74033 RepID=UPI0018DFD3D3|nr:hypothetical protein [Antarctobacter heliothermus]